MKKNIWMTVLKGAGLISTCAIAIALLAGCP